MRRHVALLLFAPLGLAACSDSPDATADGGPDSGRDANLGRDTSVPIQDGSTAEDCRADASCVAGTMCSPDECCPCSYRCAEGQWQIAACPSCVAPVCPTEEPAAGSPCGACDETLDPCVDESSCPGQSGWTADCVRDPADGIRRWNVDAFPCPG